MGGLLSMVVFLSSCSKMIVLDSKGPIGQEETFLIYISFALMLIVVIPVFVMAFWFAVRYRDTNEKATYKPKWAHSTKIEWVIWMVPIAIIVALSYLTWTRTYQLDPYKPIQSEAKTFHVEVVSMDWNWLFIYPEYHIATVNELVFPANTPLSFRLTSASVMTSFFIPQLGSQMYAMAGMQTRLNLMANEPGVYEGHNLEFSGKGYNTMHFEAIAKTPEEFKEWLEKAKKSPDTLSMAMFKKISEPNINYPETVYSSVVPGLFDHILSRFMGWMGTHKKMKMDMHMPLNHANDSTRHMNHKNMEDK
ncbi:MAG: ubiquinol oxidase subunit II [Bacteroidales bacterium]|nr:ubiquinol oxidase subunit II [Bacteroidales bacterium]